MTAGEAMVRWLCRPNLNLPGLPMGVFRIHADVLVGTFMIVGVYLVGTAYLKSRGIVPDKRRRIYLMIALFVLLVAEVTPLHDLAENFLFSMHMVQHILLVYLLPPLIIAGLPPEVYQPIVRRPWALLIARILTNPVVAIFLGNAVYAIWHVPMLYQAAAAVHEIHIFQHILMVGSAVLMWWPLFGPVKELQTLGAPAKVLYVSALNGSQLGVFAYVTFSNKLLYPYYASAPRIFGITPEVDQLLAGLVMKVSMLFILVPILTGIFFSWVREEEQRTGQRLSSA